MTRGDDGPDPWDGPRAAISWFLHTDNPGVMFLREAGSSALAVGMVGMLLFAVSGVWPPLVAVESGSMQPNMKKGDLVFVVEEQRFSPDYAHEKTGVVTHEIAVDHDYWKFGGQGDVVVYQPNGRDGTTPVIHRAMFWVNDSENWYDEANPEYVDAENCDQLRNCPAPHAGFITKGDNDLTNDYYDQARGISSPVKPSWVRGTAEYRIPWLGWVRLTVSGSSVPLPTTTGFTISEGSIGPFASSPSVGPSTIMAPGTVVSGPLAG